MMDQEKLYIQGVTPQKEFIYKKLCIYSYMLKLQSPSKYSPCDAIHLSRFFSTTQNSFWTHHFWCLLVLLPFFVSPLSHQQNVSLWGPFYPVALGKIRCIRRVGHRICLFLVKNRWTLGAVWSGALVNHPSWNGQRHWESLQKKFTEALPEFTELHWKNSMQPLTTTPAGTLT